MCVYVYIHECFSLRIDTLEMKNWFGYLNLIDYPGLIVSAIATISILYILVLSFYDFMKVPNETA